MKGTYLINTDEWFLAPDGRTYKAVFGEVTILGDDILGIKTNARSANWFAKVGSDESHVIIAGCQIHYATKCDSVNDGEIDDWNIHDGKVAEYERPTKIYIP